MKLIAKTDFYNTKSLGVTVDKKSAGFKHESIIHKGCRFEIGKGEFFKDLTPSEKEIVGGLVRTGMVIFADDKENQSNGAIKQIDDEVAAEIAAEKRRSEASAKKVPLE